MSDTKGFVDAIAHASDSTEADLAVAVAWFLSETRQERSVPFKDVCDFMESEGVRINVNRSRLQTKLVSRRDISAPKGKPISVPPATRSRLNSEFGGFLTPPPPKIQNVVLQMEDFKESRKYINAIVKQVNGCRQFEMFDACAVMMRRLAEILIIDAYESIGARGKITDASGNYKMMNGLIAALKSGADFKLSRNAPAWLDQLKELGDNAAHSRTYITKAMDIDHFAGSYRKLISELVSAQSK